MSVISLLTDLGLDTFVAEMKAVIVSICPEARIVDITHQVEKFNMAGVHSQGFYEHLESARGDGILRVCELTDRLLI